MSYKLAIVDYKKAIRDELRAMWKRNLEGLAIIRRYRLHIKELRTLIKLESCVAPTRKVHICAIPSRLERIPINYEITEPKAKEQQLCLELQKN